MVVAVQFARFSGHRQRTILTTRLLISECFGTNPVTREDGARLRHLIEQYWSDEDTLVLDFAGLHIVCLLLR